MRPICSCCRFFNPATPAPYVTSEWLRGRADGECRRRSPAIKGWPEVHAIDWCGQFAPKGSGVPAGTYRASIVEACIESAGCTGRWLCLTWQVLDGPEEGGLVMQRLHMYAEGISGLDKVVSEANAQFAAIRHATGVTIVRDTDELHGIPCSIVVGKPRGLASHRAMEVVAVLAVRP